MKLLQNPIRVLFLSLGLVFLTLIWNGNLYRLYQLHRQSQAFTDKIQHEKTFIASLNQQIGKMKDPEFIEQQALERLDFIDKDDLLFVFSED